MQNILPIQVVRTWINCSDLLPFCSLITRLRVYKSHNKLVPFQEQFDELEFESLKLFDFFSIDGRVNVSQWSLNDPGITDSKVWDFFRDYIRSFDSLNSYWPPPGFLFSFL